MSDQSANGGSSGTGLLPHARRLLDQFEILRFLIAAGLAAVVNVGSLYLAADVAGLHYLPASVLAFLLGFVVAFTLHKWWTFRESSRARAPLQIVLSALLKLVNLATYVGLIYLLVEWFSLWHIYAAVIAGAAIPIENFLAFKYLIFRREPASGKAA